MRHIKGEELTPFLHNLLCTEQDADGGTHLHRFTARQRDFYKEESISCGIDFYARALASSNVLLDMVTDSDILGIMFTLTGATRIKRTAFDLYVDGVFFDYRCFEDLDGDRLCFDLPEGEHRVTVFFPWNAAAVIKDVILEDGSSLSAAERTARILSFGDSITQGYICKHPSMCYAGRITEVLNAELLNQGIGGYHFNAGALDPALAAFHPQLITVAYGTNDYSRNLPLKELEGYASEFFAKLSEIFPQVPILYIFPVYRNDEKYHVRRRIFDYLPEALWDSYRNVCARFGNVVTLEDRFYPHPESFFAEDYLHPNDLGGVIYGDAVISKIKDLKLF